MSNVSVNVHERTPGTMAYQARIEDDAMQGRFNPGEYVLIKPVFEIDKLPIGQEVVVVTMGDRVLVREFAGFKKGRHLRLRGINPACEEIVVREKDIGTIGVVVAFGKQEPFCFTDDGRLLV